MRGSRPFIYLLLSLVFILLGVLRSTLEGGPDFLARFLWVVGAAAFLLFLIRVAGEIRFLMLHLRSFSEPGLTVTLLLAGLLLLLGSIALSRTVIQWDLTQRKAYTLSPNSSEVVKEIRRDVEIIAVFREGSADSKNAEDLMSLYRSESPHIRTRLLDPEQDPQEARSLGVTHRGFFLLRSEGREERVSDNTERALTAGLIRLITGKGREMLFSEGHSERDLRGTTAPGLSKLTRFLAEDGYSVGTLNLIYPDSFPDPPGMVILAGPRTPLLPGEARNLMDFLDRGGRVGLFLDPGVEIGLEQSLLVRGVRVRADTIKAAGPGGRSLGLEPTQLLVIPTREHPSVTYLRSRGLLDGARVVEATMPARTTAESATLLQAGPEDEVNGERSKSGEPYSVAVAASWQIPVGRESLEEIRQRPWARLIVTGDSDLFTNAYLDRQGNRQIVLSFFHWLAEEDLLLRAEGARPPELLVLNESSARTLWLIMIVLLPLAFLLGGMFVWIRARSGES